MTDLEKAGHSDASVYYGRNGNPLGYQVEVWHDGLNEHRSLKDRDIGILESKATSQLMKWDEKWQRVKTKRKLVAKRERGKEGAEAATKDAQEALHAAETLLNHTLHVDDAVDWSSLKHHAPFLYEPEEDTNGLTLIGAENRPIGIVSVDRKSEPSRTDSGIALRKNFLDKLLPPLGKKREQEADQRFSDALAKWRTAEEKAERIESERGSRLDRHNAAFGRQLDNYKRRCQEQDERVDDLRRRWQAGDREAVEEHAELVLNASEYPDWMKTDFSLAYDPSNGMLVVNFELPTTDAIPTLREITYVASRDEFKEKYITDSQGKKLYDSVLYQTALRTLHELFEADRVNVVTMTTFNGWVTSVNLGTGQTARKCILSVQTSKESFGEIDLSRVNPKICFKGLKGIAASSLSELAPVTPILQLDTEDARFVESREVAGGLDYATNLASMNWEDFEHLVRELFSKHFEQDGGEVRVTRASRDGGVDAIAFDPDPIRGGKMVIQAKRYTNTVGVGAVRDLYGTVVNEGAVKGILITTSDYGPDAYEFAKDKPLALLSGANLLHLLGQYGYKATINIEEAKRLAREA